VNDMGKTETFNVNLQEEETLTKMNDPLLVFDIDDTLVTSLSSDSLVASNERLIELTFMEEETGGTEKKHNYEFIPGVFELLQYVVLHRQLPIAFFSNAYASRNKSLIPVILERIFFATELPNFFKMSYKVTSREKRFANSC
jgi:hypothetical protein